VLDAMITRQFEWDVGIQEGMAFLKYFQHANISEVFFEVLSRHYGSSLRTFAAREANPGVA
jgi:hypothetical protein